MSLFRLIHTCVGGYYKAPWGISLFLHDYPHYQIAAKQSFVPHVLSFQIKMGRMQWFIFRCYVPPGIAADNDHITIVRGHFPYGMEPILVGNINVNF